MLGVIDTTFNGVKPVNRFITGCLTPLAKCELTVNLHVQLHVAVHGLNII
jgi:hypothetical protein